MTAPVTGVMRVRITCGRKTTTQVTSESTSDGPQQQQQLAGGLTEELPIVVDEADVEIVAATQAARANGEEDESDEQRPAVSCEAVPYCTATDPADSSDECPSPGLPCGSEVGAFNRGVETYCCPDACGRLYCTGTGITHIPHGTTAEATGSIDTATGSATGSAVGGLDGPNQVFDGISIDDPPVIALDATSTAATAPEGGSAGSGVPSGGGPGSADDDFAFIVLDSTTRATQGASEMSMVSSTARAEGDAIELDGFDVTVDDEEDESPAASSSFWQDRPLPPPAGREMCGDSGLTVDECNGMPGHACEGSGLGAHCVVYDGFGPSDADPQPAVATDSSIVVEDMEVGITLDGYVEGALEQLIQDEVDGDNAVSEEGAGSEPDGVDSNEPTRRRRMARTREKERRKTRRPRQNNNDNSPTASPNRNLVATLMPTFAVERTDLPTMPANPTGPAPPAPTDFPTFTPTGVPTEADDFETIVPTLPILTPFPSTGRGTTDPTGPTGGLTPFPVSTPFPTESPSSGGTPTVVVDPPDATASPTEGAVGRPSPLPTEAGGAGEAGGGGGGMSYDYHSSPSSPGKPHGLDAYGILDHFGRDGPGRGGKSGKRGKRTDVHVVDSWWGAAKGGKAKGGKSAKGSGWHHQPQWRPAAAHPSGWGGEWGNAPSQQQAWNEYSQEVEAWNQYQEQLAGWNEYNQQLEAWNQAQVQQQHLQQLEYNQQLDAWNQYQAQLAQQQRQQQQMQQQPQMQPRESKRRHRDRRDGGKREGGGGGSATQ